MRTILLLLFAASIQAQTCVYKYKYGSAPVQEKFNLLEFNKQEIIGFGALCLTSALDGILEGYGHDRRKSFERKFGVSPSGYFGSQSWRSIYINSDPRYGYNPRYSRKSAHRTSTITPMMRGRSDI